MRVLQLISTIGYYGAENAVFNLAQSLRDKGCHSTVATLTRSDRHSRELYEAAKQAGLPAVDLCCSGRFDYRALKKLLAFVSEHQIEVIHSHNYKSNTYAWIVARIKNLPLFATCHNWTRTDKMLRLYAAVDHFLLRGFDHVAAVSQQVAESLYQAGVHREKVSVVANGVDLRRFETMEIAANDHITIGTASRLVPGKGICDLVSVAPDLLREYPETQFLIAGEGPEKQNFEELVRKLGISRNVTFLGFQSDMKKFYGAIDIFVLPSHNEGLPMTILEAMAGGRTVVATRVGGIPQVVRESTGILYAPGKEQELKVALQRLLRDSKLRGLLAREGRQFIARNHSASMMADQYMQLYLNRIPYQSSVPARSIA